MKEYYLYRHVRFDKNEVFYIGIGTKPKNYTNHKLEYGRAYSQFSRSKFWKSVVLKTDYRVDILFESNNINEIKLKETEFINLYGRKNLNEGTLVNLTDGGELNNRRKVTPETRLLIGKMHKGKTLSPETKQKLREANLGKKVSEETKIKIGNAGKGRKLSEDAKSRIGKAAKERKADEKLNSPEISLKSKMTRRNKLPKVVYLKTGEIYNSLPDACDVLGLNRYTENGRIVRNSPLANFKYLNP